MVQNGQNDENWTDHKKPKNRFFWDKKNVTLLLPSTKYILFKVLISIQNIPNNWGF